MEKSKTAEDRRRTKRVFRDANLVLSYGKTAAIALASRGLGPETAARVVGKLERDEIEWRRGSTPERSDSGAERSIMP